MASCVFCKIVKKESPANVEMETDDVIVFSSIDPAAEIHLLICPKEHIESLASLDPTKHSDVATEMVEVAQAMIKKMQTGDGYKLIVNGGKYQAIPHLHWHLLGGKLHKKYQEKV